MLRITIELVPFGDEDRKHKIGEMLIVNTGDSSGSKGSYKAWTVSDDWSGKPARYGKLDNYDRSQSPWELIRLMLEAIRLEVHEPSRRENSIAQKLKKQLFRKGRA